MINALMSMLTPALFSSAASTFPSSFLSQHWKVKNNLFGEELSFKG
jgi:hypothetical protein